MIYKKSLKIKNRSYLKKNKKIKGGNGIYKTKCKKVNNTKSIMECIVKKNNKPTTKSEKPISELQENEKFFFETNINFSRNISINNNISTINYKTINNLTLFIIINENNKKIRLLVKNKENEVFLNYNVLSDTNLIVTSDKTNIPRINQFWLNGKENSRNNGNMRTNFMGQFNTYELNLEFQNKFNKAKKLIFSKN